MKNTGISAFIILLGILFIAQSVSGQQKPVEWTLRSCIDYALKNNISIKIQQQSVAIGKENFAQSKSSRLPNLNAGVGLSFLGNTAQDNEGQQLSYPGNYSVQSQMTLYNGLKIKNTIAQNELLVKSQELSVKESENNMELTITAAYLKILYARESVLNAENTLTSSETQYQRAKVLFDAGYIAESNYAQVQSQYSTDKYALVVAKNAESELILQLKQLLQLGINDEISIDFPALDETQVLTVLPAKQDVYNTALSFMPQVENGKVTMDIAGKDLQIAKAGYLPVLSVSASIATSYNSLTTGNYPSQMGNNFYENAGLSLNIPIFNNRQVKSSVAKAQIGVETAKLSYADTQTNLLTQVETAYLDALSAQGRFQAAAEQLKFIQISYSLIEEQFNLGMKNTVDLLTEKTKFLTAQQEYLQAKYTAILNYKILDFYQNKPITL